MRLAQLFVRSREGNLLPVDKHQCELVVAKSVAVEHRAQLSPDRAFDLFDGEMIRKEEFLPVGANMDERTVGRGGKKARNRPGSKP